MSIYLDGPSKQGSVTVSAIAVTELKVDANALSERKVVTIQPLDGNIRVYLGDNSTPTVSDVSTKGFIHVKRAKESYGAGEQQQIWIIAETGSVQVLFAERA